jgi:hypothetical protein
MDSKIILTLEEYKKFEKTEKELDECKQLIDSILLGKTLIIEKGRGIFGCYFETLAYKPEQFMKELAAYKMTVEAIKEIANGQPLFRLDKIRFTINELEKAVKNAAY